MIIGSAVLFVQRGARKIREAAFSYEAGRFIGANINVYARHITRIRAPLAVPGKPSRRKCFGAAAATGR
jgi:hypothetical protein